MYCLNFVLNSEVVSESVSPCLRLLSARSKVSPCLKGFYNETNGLAPVPTYPGPLNNLARLLQLNNPMVTASKLINNTTTNSSEIRLLSDKVFKIRQPGWQVLCEKSFSSLNEFMQKHKL